MKAIETTIRDAVQKGGYKATATTYDYPQHSTLLQCAIFLDPSFWQALGKARGWNHQITFYNTFPLRGDSKENNDPWRLYWHRFIDHLADGKDAELFFASL